MKSINLTYISDNGVSFPLVATSMYLKEASFHEYSWNPEAVGYKLGDLLKIFTKDVFAQRCLAQKCPDEKACRYSETVK